MIKITRFMAETNIVITKSMCGFKKKQWSFSEEFVKVGRKIASIRLV